MVPYSFEVTHRKGGAHVDADYFSQQTSEEDTPMSLLEVCVCKVVRSAAKGGPSYLLTEDTSGQERALEASLMGLGIQEV